MPTPIGHSIAGLAISCGAGLKLTAKNYDIIIASFFAANAPDLDFLFGYLSGNPNKYHHQFTHSIFFALLMGLGLALLLIRKESHRFVKLAIYFFVLNFVHLGLDFVTLDTSAPFGEMLLWPVSNSYYISPYVIFSDVQRASTSGDFFISLFSKHNFITILIELGLTIPILVIGIIIGRKKRPAILGDEIK